MAKYTAAKAAYKKCEGEIPFRPEASKIADGASTRMDKAKTSEETQAAMAWMQKEMAGLMTKVCGTEPGAAPEYAPDLTKAQEAGAIEFGKGATRKAVPDKPSQDPAPRIPECPDLGSPTEDANAANIISCGDESSAGDEDESLQGLQGVDPKLLELYLNQYALFKELIAKFCSLDKQSRADAVKSGIRVQGSNNTIYWIFSKEFASMVNPHCDALMALLTELM
jgi:hypothetical protein